MQEQLRGHFILQSTLRSKIIKILLEEEILSESDIQEMKSAYKDITTNDTQLTGYYIKECEGLKKVNHWYGK